MRIPAVLQTGLVPKVLAGLLLAVAPALAAMPAGAASASPAPASGVTGSSMMLSAQPATDTTAPGRAARGSEDREADQLLPVRGRVEQNVDRL